MPAHTCASPGSRVLLTDHAWPDIEIDRQVSRVVDIPAGLRTHPGTILTPHVAFSSDGSLAELRRRALQEVVRVLHGERTRHACNTPKHACNTPKSVPTPPPKQTQS